MYLKLYLNYFKIAMKNIVEYRADFFIGILSMLVEQIIAVSTLFLIFNSIPSINGWVLDELILMYAFSTLGRGIDLIFFDSYWSFGWAYLITGQFDRVLTRPINSVFQITAERINIHGIGNTLVGLLALIYSFSNLDISVSFINIIMIIVLSLCSGFIYGGINLFLMTISFWIQNSTPLMTVTFTMSLVGRYPISIFPPVLGIISSFILPYSFTGYYPATFFFEGDHFSKLSLLTPLIAVLVWIVANAFWKYGNKKYVGAGN